MPSPSPSTTFPDPRGLFLLLVWLVLLFTVAALLPPSSSVGARVLPPAVIRPVIHPNAGKLGPCPIYFNRTGSLWISSKLHHECQDLYNKRLFIVRPSTLA